MYEARRVLARSRGITADRVPAGPVREHVQRLRGQGLGYKRIAEISGVSSRVLAGVIWGHSGRMDAGPQRWVTHRTAARILAVDVSLETLAPGRRVASTGTRRRLQALIALGWSRARLAAAMGVTEHALGRAITGTQCTVRTALAARRVYADLWDQAPPAATSPERQAATRARNDARAHGWVPPLAWDDDTIDDPAAMPAGMEPPARRVPMAERIDELEFLLDHGASADDARARSGFESHAWALTALRRAGRADLADRLIAGRSAA